MSSPASVMRASRADRRALGEEPHDRAGGHRLARAGFADERDGLALVKLEGHVAHRLDDAALDLEVDADVARVEDQLAAVRAEVVALRRGEWIDASAIAPSQ